ncbi:putative copper resistance protein (plasmid) [Nocardia farcinica IFM 10152]|uniref:Putative copper resistance protein n=2 Tax=Nocardiaceae TaxID=85025 RepID=Q5YML4_NOCFA|nr:putative copper resistance protein [Nocardia farcinica IFM 10152]
MMLTALGLTLTAGSARAHSQLDSSVPAADAVVDTPLTLITLTFNQQIGTAFANVGLTDAAGTSWAAQVSKVEGKTVRVAVSPTMPAQKYTVAYRVVSDDGHPITGSYEFTYASGSATTTAPSGAPSPSSVTAAGESSATALSSSLPWPLIVAVIVLIGGAVVTLRAATRTKR